MNAVERVERAIDRFDKDIERVVTKVDKLEEDVRADVREVRDRMAEVEATTRLIQAGIAAGRVDMAEIKAMLTGAQLTGPQPALTWREQVRANAVPVGAASGGAGALVAIVELVKMLGPVLFGGT